MLDPALYVNTPVAGRACGSCTLCCKVYDVPVLNKPAGKWCAHCAPGRGCGIHATRPEHCRAFFCLWMTDKDLDDTWRPERSKLVLTIDPGTRFLFVQVDPGTPKAWRGEPHYTLLKRWAAGHVKERRYVIVFVNKQATVLLPERDVDVGTVMPQDRVVIEPRQTMRGLEHEVRKVPGQQAQQ